MGYPPPPQGPSRPHGSPPRPPHPPQYQPQYQPPPRPPQRGFWSRQLHAGLAREGRQLARLKYVWPIVLVLILISAALAAANVMLRGAGGGGTGPGSGTSRQPDPGAFVGDFLDDLVRDRVDAAYGRLCSPTREAYDVRRFGDYVHSHKMITWGTHDRTPRPTVGPSRLPDSTASVRSVEYFLVTYADRSRVMRGFLVVTEGQDYKVCGDPY